MSKSLFYSFIVCATIITLQTITITTSTEKSSFFKALLVMGNIVSVKSSLADIYRHLTPLPIIKGSSEREKEWADEKEIIKKNLLKNGLNPERILISLLSENNDYAERFLPIYNGFLTTGNGIYIYSAVLEEFTEAEQEALCSYMSAQIACNSYWWNAFLAIPSAGITLFGQNLISNQMDKQSCLFYSAGLGILSCVNNWFTNDTLRAIAKNMLTKKALTLYKEKNHDLQMLKEVFEKINDMFRSDRYAYEITILNAFISGPKTGQKNGIIDFFSKLLPKKNKPLSPEIELKIRPILKEMGVKDWQTLRLYAMDESLRAQGPAYVYGNSMFINEISVQHLPDQQFRFLIGHEASHIIYKDSITGLLSLPILGAISYTATTLVPQYFYKQANGQAFGEMSRSLLQALSLGATAGLTALSFLKLARFKEARADKNSVQKLDCAQGCIDYFKGDAEYEQLKKDHRRAISFSNIKFYISRLLVTHPSASESLKMAQEYTQLKR